MNPQEYGMPDGFQHWGADPAEDRIGPLFYSTADGALRGALRVADHHCNAYGGCHGGVLMTLADYVLCLAGLADGGDVNGQCATVSLNTEFVARVSAGDLVIGTGTCTRRTKSLAFARAELAVDTRCVMTASAVLRMF